MAHDKFRPDLKNVLTRARKYGVVKFLMTGTYYEDSNESYKLSLKDQNYYCTAGIHPCLASEIDKGKIELSDYFEKIEKIVKNAKRGKLVAVGECGLDFDRLRFSSKEAQLKAFPPHFELAKTYKLPMYFHERNAGYNFCKIVKENRDKFTTGVVHSFTDDLATMKELLSMDLYIGINGCSLKTKENLDAVKEIPLDRLLLETDSPFCKIGPTSPAYNLIKTQFLTTKKRSESKLVRSRNEPCTIVQVLEAIAAIKNVSEETIAEAAWKNSLKLFGIEK